VIAARRLRYDRAMAIFPGRALALALLLAGCGDGGGDDELVPGPCTGYDCKVVDCGAQQRGPTAIRGTVFAPNGTLPLRGVTVYVPGEPPGALPERLPCARCKHEAPASAVSIALSGETGGFVLFDAPAGDDIPLVIATGKWRRQIRIPHVEACADTAVAAEDTRLPRDRTEGDLPRIALTTGREDALECLLRKLGVADAEVTTDTDGGHVHLFAGTGGLQSFAGGQPFPSATTLWMSAPKLGTYDLVLLSCEGAQNAATKPQPALDAMKAYADGGGRVLASHWHNIWLAGASGGPTQPAWSSIATWSNSNVDPGNPILIDQATSPLGPPLATWMVNVKGTGSAAETGVGPTTVQGQLSLDTTTRYSLAKAIDPAKAERRLYTSGAAARPQMFEFTTPVEQPPNAQCGKVLFTDVHVPGAPLAGAYPDACSGTALTPQEKALAFSFFELGTCIRDYSLGP